MRFSGLVIFVIIGITSMLFTKNYMKSDMLELEVEQNSILPAMQGDVVSYTFKIKSGKDLRCVDIKPSIKGANEDCFVEYNFDETTKTATINYFYSLPEGASMIDSITLSLKVTDENSTVEFSEVIPVYNPPLMASLYETGSGTV